jgi:tetratricopeptide (TPR) repeat protein
MARSPPPETKPDSPRITRPRNVPVTAACCVALLVFAVGSAVAQPSLPLACDDWRAELIAVEGIVEVQRARSDAWTRVAESEVLCFGDSVRVQAFSRVMVRLRDQTAVRLDERSMLTLRAPNDGIGSLIDLIRGVIHIISRDPRSLQFTTPYANAGLEGTEFDIRVNDEERKTEIAVLEGTVVVTNPMGRIEVPSNFVAEARDGEEPVMRAILEPIELMRWASYFPEIFAEDLPGPEQEPRASEIDDAAFYAARAAARLRRGQLETADADIASSLRLAPSNADALALQAIAALGRNDFPSARDRARAAVGATPPTPAAFIAMSYVLQSDGDLAGALAQVASAISLDPANAVALARRAEIELGLRRWSDSHASALRAIALDPQLGYARTVLGFIELSGGNVAEAVAAFGEGATLDRGAPLPHLGLALALMQRGDLVPGREQLEIAVALDPANALTRSYMGKTYDAENRTKLPGTQLALAKRFAPNDPTPWLYEALVKLNRNQPVGALGELIDAISRNDNRALFRSRLAMDADLATRSAGTGRVLRELGFEQLAFVRGWAATAIDPTDYAAPRLLADVYSARPGLEISRSSALLTSQLLQPANLTPISPQLGQASPLLVSRAGPSELAFNGLTPLVTANGLRFQASTVVGANETRGEDIALAGLRDRVSYSFGQYHYSTQGFRENNDFDQTIANAFVQFNPNEVTSLLAEIRSSEVEHGDLLRYFDPTRVITDFRFVEDADTLRLGVRRQLGIHDTLLATASWIDSSGSIETEFYSSNVNADANNVDVQHIHEAARWNLRSGVLLAQKDEFDVTRFVDTIESGPVDASQESAYAYANIGLVQSLILTLGASADGVEEGDVSKDRINPKVGVTWMPTEKLTVRAASFKTLHGTLTTSKQNPQPRLEPFQVAGFNQFPLAANGDEATVSGFAIDGKVSSKLFLGVELTGRDVESSVNDLARNPVATEATEEGARTYLYWTPRQDVSFSAQYQNDHLSSDENGPLRVTFLRTQRLPLEARYFHANGFSAGIRTSRFHQEGEFVSGPEGGAPEAGEDDFWIVDLSLGYRLPNRRGVLSLNVDNLLDEEFRFQDLDPENPSIMPERMAYFRFTLSFD